MIMCEFCVSMFFFFSNIYRTYLSRHSGYVVKIYNSIFLANLIFVTWIKGTFVTKLQRDWDGASGLWVKYVQANSFFFFQAFKSEDLPRFTQNLFSDEENSECRSPDPDLVSFDRIPDDVR
jgi:hypothetical protein